MGASRRKPFVYLDATDLGKLATGAYDEGGIDSAIVEIAEGLRSCDGKLLFSPLQLMEIDAGPNWLLEEFFQLLSNVPWAYTPVWPEGLYEVEVLSALAEIELGKPCPMEPATYSGGPETVRRELDELRPEFERRQEANTQFAAAESFAKGGRRMEGVVTSKQAIEAVENTESEDWDRARDHILALLEKRGVIKARELEEFDITSAYLNSLAEDGVV